MKHKYCILIIVQALHTMLSGVQLLCTISSSHEHSVHHITSCYTAMISYSGYQSLNNWYNSFHLFILAYQFSVVAILFYKD